MRHIHILITILCINLFVAFTHTFTLRKMAETKHAEMNAISRSNRPSSQKFFNGLVTDIQSLHTKNTNYASSVTNCLGVGFGSDKDLKMLPRVLRSMLCRLDVCVSDKVLKTINSQLNIHLSTQEDFILESTLIQTDVYPFLREYGTLMSVDVNLPCR